LEVQLEAPEGALDGIADCSRWQEHGSKAKVMQHTLDTTPGLPVPVEPRGGVALRITLRESTHCLLGAAKNNAHFARGHGWVFVEGLGLHRRSLPELQGRNKLHGRY